VNSGRIYLDYAATAPMRAEVAAAMRDAAESANYNPSSLHAEGRRAAALLDAARDRAATLLHVAPDEITFTSGGTEADNLALIGVMLAGPKDGHVVSSGIEHHAVLGGIEQLSDLRYEVTVLPVGADGLVEVATFAGALRPRTLLASVMYANNETGTIQPIAELAAAARERGTHFHTDAVQAPSWLPLDVPSLGVDMLSLSAHKFHGPQGVGLLYVRRGVPIVPLPRGGGQEYGRRAGTQNVIGAVGMVCALGLAIAERKEVSLRIGALRNRLEAGIRSAIPDVHINAAGSARLPNFTNVSFAGLRSDELLIALDLAGIAVSAGSACTSGSLEPSHVLTAMGTQPRWCESAIRFSLGTTTSAEQIDRVLAVLPPLVAGLRQHVGALQGDG
jgi:cysteine desulfurase